MEYPQFLDHNGLTESGIKLVAWLDAYCESTDEQRGNMSLAGHIGHYYVNVHKLTSMNPRQWVEEFQHSAVRSAWNDMVYIEEHEQTKRDAAEAKDATNDLAEALAEIKAQLVEVKQALANERRKNTNLSKKIESREADENEGDVEPEAETKPESGEVVDAPVDDVDLDKADEKDDEQEADENEAPEK